MRIEAAPTLHGEQVFTITLDENDMTLADAVRKAREKVTGPPFPGARPLGLVSEYLLMLMLVAIARENDAAMRGVAIPLRLRLLPAYDEHDGVPS